MKYACIRKYRVEFPVRMMCRLLAVRPSGFYAWLKRPESLRRRENRKLIVEIRAIHERSRGTYGSPRIHAELQGQGNRCGRHRVAGLMRVNGLTGRQRRKFRHTTDSQHALPVAENLLGQRFTVPEPDTAWVADITY